MKHLFLIAFLFIATHSINAQSDSTKDDIFSIHVQTTVINQYKSPFTVKYTGTNSLIPQEENKTSITSTLFLGARLWKGSSVFLNPEIAGGSGLSEVLGVADATNGETFRIGSPQPKIYPARIFFKQIFHLKDRKIPTDSSLVHNENGFNQVAAWVPVKYISITIGKIGVADYFDDNEYSHNPRTQFLCWGLMDNGAWDYAANTRGYTPSIVIEFVSPKTEIRYGVSLVPRTANGSEMNWDLSKASSHTLEYTRNHKIKGRKGSVRVLGFFTTTNMGDYRQSIALNPQQPNIIDTRRFGNSKFGFGINMDQTINKSLGCFFRASWNDGRHETWMFTEIDRSVSGGINIIGNRWKRSQDNIGFAMVASGISKPHRDYLKAGGKGFMLGDGNLNYTLEYLSEIYYSAALVNDHIFFTTAYQFLLNPGYNRDRQGPVSIFSVRLHSRF